jgi:virulence factor Mce-like protein
MPTRHARTSVTANPILIGAVTTLVVIVAVFLSYNANDGLPFVPTYSLKVVVPDAAQLLPGNDVRIGGSRAGVVDAVDAVPGAGPRGVPAARISVKLEAAANPLPRDTRAVVRQRSNLGLKYLEIIPGRDRATLPAGATIPLEQATGVTDLDDALSVFDAPTRSALRGVVRGLGAGLAGRGGDLNRAIEELPGATASLRSVAANLRADATDLTGFLRGARAATAALAPVSEPLGDLLAAGARTFAALDAERGALDRALRVAPGVERVSVQGFRDARPLFAEVAALLTDARPAIRELGPAARRVRAGLAAVGPTLQRARPTAVDLRTTLTELATLSARPTTAGALKALTPAVASTEHALQTIVPFQTACNYLGLWTHNVPGVISEGDALGTWFRFIPVVQLDEDLQSARPAPQLHADVNPDTGAGGECEPGNESYVPGQQIGGAPGRQPLQTHDTKPQLAEDQP